MKETTTAEIETNSQTMQNIPPESYQKYWAEIDSLDKKRLPESALEKVNDLYKIAKEDENGPQEVKCLIYKFKYEQELNESGFTAGLLMLEQKIDSLDFPAQALMQSYLASLYQNYLDQNLWQIQNRTTLSDPKDDDIETWTYDQLVGKINSLYFKSLDHKGLTEVPLESVKELLNNFDTNEKRRTTLFDLLAFEAIDYFKNERYGLNQPVYTFQIEDEAAFADAKPFTDHTFETKDSTSFKWYTLLLFQKTLKEQMKAGNDVALVDADLQRLSFVRNNTILSNKDELYKKALDNLKAELEGNELQALILFELAELSRSEGQQYEAQAYWQEESPEQLALKNKFVEAANICKEATKKYPGSVGAKKCQALLARLESKSLGLTTEEIFPEGKNILAKLQYHNLDRAFIKVVKVDEKKLQDFEDTRWNERMKFINELPVGSSWETKLPDPKDYRMHSIEFSVPKQELGQYFLVVSDNTNFTDEGGAVSYALIQVSNLALVHINNNDSNKKLFVVTNRIDGKPVSDVRVEFVINDYAQLTRKQFQKTVGNATSDKNGMFYFKTSEHHNFKIKMSKGYDVQSPNEFFYTYPNGNEKTNHSIQYFLDRKIYRPGQTVHFKALVLKNDENRIPSIVPNEKLDFTFYDANGQAVETIQLLTNEYGSCSGSFIAPSSGLLGNMSIRCTGNLSRLYENSVNFRVEEYKRPKFEVSLDENKEEISLGDMVTVNGKAIAYAGYPINGANFTYRVVRNVRYPYWPWWRWGRPAFNSPETTIKNGTGITNEAGEILFEFEATPDPTIDKKSKPEFSYSIYVDVTDTNGETQSSQSSIRLAYTSLYLDILTGEEINLSNFDTLKIKSSNIQGQDLEAEVQVKIEKLKTPEKPFIERYWPYPDQIGIPSEEFKGLFPDYSFNGQENEQNWPIEKTVWEKKVQAKGETNIALNASSIEQGMYIITLTGKDKSGLDIETKQYIKVIDEKSNKPVVPEFLWVQNPDKSFEPGENCNFSLKTSLSSIPVLMREARLKNEKDPYWKTINGKSEINLPIEETDRGNIHFAYTYVQQNRFFNKTSTINVPWTNKDLEVSFSTFRDKLEPGSKETWNITISGPKKDKVAAEMLVSMYDASLDAFESNNWRFRSYPFTLNNFTSKEVGFNSLNGQYLSRNWQTFPNFVDPAYPNINFFGANYYAPNRALSNRSEGVFYYIDGIRIQGNLVPDVELEESVIAMKSNSEAPMDSEEMKPPRTALNEVPDNDSGSETDGNNNQDDTKTEEVSPRTNLKETVFFFPDLKTDADGNIIFSFTMNEALTKWKFQGFAHTKELAAGMLKKDIVTQKDLMVVPNPPRFFREGDEITFSAKVVNLSEKDLSGTVKLDLFDALSGKEVNKKLGNRELELPFQIKAGSSESFSWPLEIPSKGIMAVSHRVTARAGSFSDAEESTLPILTNRMLVTETLPLPVRGESEGTFVLNNLKDNNSKTLDHQSMTLEFTQNPAWYAVKSLPYLMEYPYECTEQTFSRFYANSLASHVANAHPKVKRVFDAWKNYQPEALESQLTKNQELKSALLEETPWVFQAQSEVAQRKNIGLLFDLNRMASEQENALRKLADRQEGNGGWSWFPGGRPDWYITQYIVEGMGHLKKLGVSDADLDQKYTDMRAKAVQYIDFELKGHYEDLKESVEKGEVKLGEDHLSNIVIHYLYARSFFIKEGNWKKTGSDKYEVRFANNMDEALNYYLEQSKKFALNKGLYQQGMLALALRRWEAETTISNDIVKSLKERSLNHPELGMYWKYPSGWWWYQAPIETHSLMIEVFDEVANDEKSVDDLKVWLLKNKQTTHWKTTKATANAVYALLMNGDNWLLEDKPISFEWAGEKFMSSDFDQEAGSGYFKTSWSGDYLENKESRLGNEAIATVKVANPNKNVAWGAMYWQYFEQLDKIKTFEETPLTMQKEIYKVIATDRGEQLEEVTNSDGKYLGVKIGDKLKIRIILRVDRDMEYVHMKDMRASGLEPIQVLSQYKWQDGLGYYESPGDVATNFFFSYLPKGTYVFEYPLRVQHAGDFSNGISSIQSMYAPEFTSHSAGVRLEVEK